MRAGMPGKPFTGAAFKVLRTVLNSLVRWPAGGLGVKCEPTYPLPDKGEQTYPPFI
jgi:hypothetical protein